MTRLARVVRCGIPHHITHRGNHGDRIFEDHQDRSVYRRYLGESSQRYGLRIWAYSWLTNHIHMLAVPEKPDSLARAIGVAHRKYAHYFNRKRGKRGHLWEGRFYSAAMDEEHLWAAARYVEMNPVGAGLVDVPEQYPWSSARAHCGRGDDSILAPDRPFPGRIDDWAAWLRSFVDPELINRVRQCTGSGRPCGSDRFVAELESSLGRSLTRGKAGRPRKKRTGDRS